MALLFMDSFDHYATADVGEKWTAGGTPTIAAAAGRRASSALRAGTGTNTVQSAVLPVSGSVAVIGVAVKVVTLGTANRALLWVISVGGIQLSLVVTSVGVLQVFRGDTAGTLLGTTSHTFSVGTYYYLELKTTVHPSAGTVDLLVNGASVLTPPLTGVNTANTGTAGWNAVRLGTNGSGAAFDYDDVYVLDGSGASPLNDVLGDCRVDARYPTAPGATTGWTPSTAPNWSCVDDVAPNDDTDYVTATASGLTDTYVLQDAPVAGGTIYGVQLLWNVKKMDAGTCSVAPVVRHGGSDVPGTVQNPGTTYAYGRQVYGTNPGTSAAWTESDFNAAEFGVSRTA